MALNRLEIPESVRQDILDHITNNSRELGEKDFDECTHEEREVALNRLEGLTPTQAFEKWCRWNGLEGGYSTSIIRALDGLRKAEVK